MIVVSVILSLLFFHSSLFIVNSSDVEEENIVQCPGQREFCDCTGDCVNSPGWCSCEKAQDMDCCGSYIGSEDESEDECGDDQNGPVGACYDVLTNECNCDAGRCTQCLCEADGAGFWTDQCPFLCEECDPEAPVESEDGDDDGSVGSEDESSENESSEDEPTFFSSDYSSENYSEDSAIDEVQCPGQNSFCDCLEDCTDAPEWCSCEEARTPECCGRNIVDIAQDNGDFSSFGQLLYLAGLVEFLEGDGPFTVFAPTNSAFDALPDDIVTFLTDPENVDALVDILTYHVVGDNIPSSALSVGAMVTALNGQTLTVTSLDPPTINESVVTVADAFGTNGVIHVIDTVLIPPDESSSDEDMEDIAGEAFGIIGNMVALMTQMIGVLPPMIDIIQTVATAPMRMMGRGV